ncbi:HEAT repeat domain-containing protein [Nitrosopumilus sp. K4]|uniref:HEAT repeat domain-containing protein n=1 Tax=Nitrosopumilus sp. K4 TaxID=2795383 RepID=UPI001BAA576E|nr:HEAT repeat domain-containing protein [Nitrosopumilus sp. K4]QUC64286.1 HEAT repeat domain-containing protein [Nitrosopumilus sp. K4]
MDETLEKLDFGTNHEKIKTLESLAHTNDFQIIEKIISKLDDEDIQVRGEAFSSLILNENKISDLLIKSLKSNSKYVRGFSALVLANRNDSNAISEIIRLTADGSSLVRSCALGALGHLKAKDAKDAIESCLTDSNIEVIKSALQAAINIDDVLPENKIKEIAKEDDPELERLLICVKRKSGPEGI